MTRPCYRWCLWALCLAMLVSLGACGKKESAKAPNVATGSASLQHDLDAALEKARSSTGAPAATGTVRRCGQLLWSGASGVRNVESRPPVTPDTPFVVASTVKPMTAALALGLVEDGKLSLDSKLSRFYPDLPSAREITVRMLLDHTSGLMEYFDDPQLNHTIISDPDHDWTRAEVLRGVTRTEFEPGTDYAYSNSAYVVLGGIVEKVSGETIEEAFREQIAEPVGLPNSTFTYEPGRSEQFAHPYLRTNGGLKDAYAPGVGIPSDFWGPVWTDGGLASTSPDLARFGDALFGGEILEPEMIEQMTRENRFGSRLGLDDKSYAGREWLGHNGRYVGYESELWYDGSRGLTVAVNTNAEHSSLTTWKKMVATYDDAEPDTGSCDSGFHA